LFSDFGYQGLVIINKTRNISFLKDKSQVIVDSGLSNASLLMAAASHDLGGIEYLYPIKGSLGGVVYNNLQFNHYSLEQNLKKITLFKSDGEIVTYKAPWLRPTATGTRLKEMPDKAIILTITLQLQRSRQEDIIRKIKELKITIDTPLESGDIFYNPPNHDIRDLLQSANVKKLRVGDALVSRNPNRIINRKAAQAADVRKLIEDMKQAVLDKHGLLPDEIVEYVGSW
jgi:UDP-N-acetylenolpyruvoylglucosamine reductase